MKVSNYFVVLPHITFIIRIFFFQMFNALLQIKACWNVLCDYQIDLKAFRVGFVKLLA